MRGFLSQAAFLVGATALATGVALLLGAANLGTALAVGQVSFVLALVYVLVRA